MAIRTEFTFPSRDGIHQCHAYSWAPDNGEIRAVFQIVHGMIEYMDRYDDFACYLASHGFLVVGEDHLGHGLTVKDNSELGYFCAYDADTILVRDVHRLKKITQDANPGKPYFILGHSMGSFIFRKYLTMYGKGIDGAIVMGTGTMPSIVTGTGIFLTHVLRLFKGDHYKSSFIENMAFGAYNKRIPDARTASDWLTKDTGIVDTYINDPLCTFKFTLNGYRTLFKLLKYVCKKSHLTTIPKNLPIYVTAGDADPVGSYGTGPTKVYEQYKGLGIKDVSLKLYENGRHEILNETNRSQVYEDILNWLTQHIEN